MLYLFSTYVQNTENQSHWHPRVATNTASNIWAQWTLPQENKKITESDLHYAELLMLTSNVTHYIQVK